LTIISAARQQEGIMSVTEHPTKPVRGRKSICLPCSPQEYEQVVGDPVLFRRFLDRHLQATPDLFPPEIERGYRMKDLYTSRKTGCKLRRIELRNLQCFLIRPPFLMPYLSGRTEDVQAPLFSASSPSRTGHWPKSSDARRCTGIAWSARWDATAW
jgi:hypothetical protein